MSLPLKILNFCAFLLFGLFSAAQYNDIDPAVYYHPSSVDAALWLLFYAFIAVLFLVIIFKPLPRWLLGIAVLACLVQLGRTAPGLWVNLFGERSFSMTQTSMSAEDPRVELSREFFGALIALGATGVLWWERRKRVPANDATGPVA